MSEIRPPTVVIVDDDEAICDAVSALVDSVGWTPLAFASPQHALSSDALGSADCLLVDVHMPEIDGIELVRRLRAGGLMLPTLFMTGRNRPGLEAATRAVGGAALLEKPFDPEALLAAMRSALAARD